MINEKLRSELSDQLMAAVLLLRNTEESYAFFEDICTLRRGNTYDAIVERTGASTATISRVKRCLNYGADGYELVLERMRQQKEEKNRQEVDEDVRK